MMRDTCTTILQIPPLSCTELHLSVYRVKKMQVIYQRPMSLIYFPCRSLGCQGLEGNARATSLPKRPSFVIMFAEFLKRREVRSNHYNHIYTMLKVIYQRSIRLITNPYICLRYIYTNKNNTLTCSMN